MSHFSQHAGSPTPFRRCMVKRKYSRSDSSPEPRANTRARMSSPEAPEVSTKAFSAPSEASVEAVADEVDELESSNAWVAIVFYSWSLHWHNTISLSPFYDRYKNFDPMEQQAQDPRSYGPDAWRYWHIYPPSQPILNDYDDDSLQGAPSFLSF